MRKNVFGRRLSRDTQGRTALFKHLITALIKYGSIKTTQAKSKAIKGLVDKVVGAAKEGSLPKRRFLLSMFSKDTVKKLVNEVAPRFKTRTSGFTRITKIGTRISDNASMVMMEWVEGMEVKTEEVKDKKIAEKETRTHKVQKKVVIRKKKAAIKKVEKKKQ